MFDIAVRNGWRVFHKEQDGIWIVEFRRKTFSGVPFCFTVEMEYGKVENLVSEIISFADAIDPETCAVEWMILSGAVSPSCYQQAVADMIISVSKSGCLSMICWGLSEAVTPRSNFPTMNLTKRYANGIMEYHFSVCALFWEVHWLYRLSNPFLGIGVSLDWETA